MPYLRASWHLQEVNRVSEVVTSLADPSANVIFGAVIDDQVGGRHCWVLGCERPEQLAGPPGAGL